MTMLKFISCICVLIFTEILPGEVADEKVIVSKVVSSAPVIDGKLDDPCWKQAESTGLWKVLGKMSETVLGQWEAAPEKFVKAAASARVCHDAKNVYVAISVPAPADLPVSGKITQRDGNVWSGDDCVELFLDPGRQMRYYQILVNPLGTVADLRVQGGGEDLAWNAGAIVKVQKHGPGFVVEMAIPFSSLGTFRHHPGDAWGINFTREGPSGGGFSTWAPVGTTFNSPERFGLLIFGDRNSFYTKALTNLEKRLNKSEDVTSIQKQITAVRKQLQERNLTWSEFNTRQQEIETAIRQVELKGKTYLLWTKSIWGDIGPDEKVPATAKPLTVLKVIAGQNTRVPTGFLISNLTARPLMGHLVWNTPDPKVPSLARKKMTIRRGVYIELDNGRMIPDALVELPPGDLIEVPPRTTQVIWVEVDTHDLAAGIYKRTATFLPSYSGFTTTTFDLEVQILPVDLAGPAVKTFTYLADPNIQRFRFAAEDLVRHGVTTAYFIPALNKGYPVLDKDGNVVNLDTVTLDAILSNMEQAGVPRNQLTLLISLAMNVSWCRDLNVESSPRLVYGTEVWKKGFINSLRAFRDHLFKRGLTYEQILFYPVDEPCGDPDDPKTGAFAAFEGAGYIRQADPKFRLFANPYVKDEGAKYLPQWFKLFDVVEPYQGFLETNPAVVKACRESGREIWIYGIEAKVTASNTYRNLFWQSAAFGFSGNCAFWCYERYSGDMFNSYDPQPERPNVNADYGMAYVDFENEKVIPSRRWEAYYQGNQDFRTITICRELITQLKTQGTDTTVYEKTLAAEISKGRTGSSDEKDASRYNLFFLIMKMQKNINSKK